MNILLMPSCFLLTMGIARAGVAPPDVGIDQHIGSQLPMHAVFRNDGDGASRPLADYFHQDRPVILVMGYFECPQLCSVVMNGLVESLTEIHPRAGRDFDVIFASIDPGETPALAASKKRGYIRHYGREGTENGWHFITGSPESIGALASAMGFRYLYDAKLDQYAHGSGIAIVTPSGTISRYFYGIEYPPKDLAAALRDAREEKQGIPVEEVLLLCYHFNPISGPYGMVIWRTLQASALVTVLALGGFIVKNLRAGRPVRDGKEAGP